MPPYLLAAFVILDGLTSRRTIARGPSTESSAVAQPEANNTVCSITEKDTHHQYDVGFIFTNGGARCSQSWCSPIRFMSEGLKQVLTSEELGVANSYTSKRPSNHSDAAVKKCLCSLDGTSLFAYYLGVRDTCSWRDCWNRYSQIHLVARRRLQDVLVNANEELTSVNHYEAACGPGRNHALTVKEMVRRYRRSGNAEVASAVQAMTAQMNNDLESEVDWDDSEMNSPKRLHDVQEVENDEEDQEKTEEGVGNENDKEEQEKTEGRFGQLPEQEAEAVEESQPERKDEEEQRKENEDSVGETAREPDTSPEMVEEESPLASSSSGAAGESPVGVELKWKTDSPQAQSGADEADDLDDLDDLIDDSVGGVLRAVEAEKNRPAAADAPAADARRAVRELQGGPRDGASGTSVANEDSPPPRPNASPMTSDSFEMPMSEFELPEARSEATSAEPANTQGEQADTGADESSEAGSETAASASPAASSSGSGRKIMALDARSMEVHSASTTSSETPEVSSKEDDPLEKQIEDQPSADAASDGVEDSAPGRWELLYSKGSYGEEILPSDLFNNLVRRSTGIVKRVCRNCLPTHKTIYIKRKDQLESWDAFSDLLVTWHCKGHHEVFDIYSSFEDMMADRNSWNYCNGDAEGVGFPRESGPENASKGQWNSFVWDGGLSDVGYYAYFEADTPKAEASSVSAASEAPPSQASGDVGPPMAEPEPVSSRPTQAWKMQCVPGYDRFLRKDCKPFLLLEVYVHPDRNVRGRACESMGCCWDPLEHNSREPWCFHVPAA
eukprot:TRINITY_DN31775_c0_g1_i1.p1 TRINITY_DN31775_c0_g1~~TRINITY_DN31775_c0_g1_i1.p1  ORF type:complete len:787 (-),score=166.46 TRINITY_DN31775_c0_g1_i1:77-2437(-)